MNRSRITNPLRFCELDSVRPGTRRLLRSWPWLVVPSRRRLRYLSILRVRRTRTCAERGSRRSATAPPATTRPNVVLNLLQDKYGFVVRTACEVAAVLGLARAHDRILELAEIGEEATRLSALSALESLWVPADFERVFARYVKDQSAGVRKQAAWTLCKHASPEHWEQVFESWSKDPVPRHRVWACSIAEKFGDRTVVARLNALRSDPDGHVRCAAERALKVMGES